jgi:U3 small nucleolar RNA-associated protein MPP10
MITPEVTQGLEAIIKKRIKEASWDDVVRKKENLKPYKPQIELDQEKSKIGLGEVYEKEVKKIKNNKNIKIFHFINLKKKKI